MDDVPCGHSFYEGALAYNSTYNYSKCGLENTGGGGRFCFNGYLFSASFVALVS